MNTFFIKNARNAVTEESLSLWVEEGKIKEVNGQAPNNIPVIDAGSAFLLPGLFDLHARLGQPGHPQRETILQASEAAINGGITGLCAMSDTKPALDCAHLIRNVQEMCRECRIPIHTAGCITEKGEGMQQAPYSSLADSGIRILSDGRYPPHNPLLLRRAMQYAGDMELVFAMRGDTPELTSASVAHESSTSYKLGLPAEPACAEEMGVFRIMSLASDTGAQVHIQTLSTAKALEVFRTYKAKGKFTSEVALHHLIFTHRDIGDLDTCMKTVPPLRRREDTEALLQALSDGTIDCLVSDHTPCTTFEKQQDFCSAPEGMIGLDTFMPAAYTYLISSGKLSWTRFIEAASSSPRKLLGIPTINLEAGEQADFVLFHPEETTQVTAEFLKSKARNTPWLNQELKGRVVLVCRNHILKNEY